MSRRGRPTKLSPEIQDAICNNIRAGLNYDLSAQLAGICQKTFYTWRMKAEAATSGKYYNFLQAIKKANVEARANCLKTIHEARQGNKEFTEEHEEIEKRVEGGKEIIVARKQKTIKKRTVPQWQAAAWILERRFPGEYGRHIPPPADNDKDPLDGWLDDLRAAGNEFDGCDFGTD